MTKLLDCPECELQPVKGDYGDLYCPNCHEGDYDYESNSYYPIGFWAYDAEEWNEKVEDYVA